MKAKKAILFDYKLKKKFYDSEDLIPALGRPHFIIRVNIICH